MTMLSILTLRVPPDRSDDVVRYYESARILELSGALSSQLAVKSDDPGTIVVLATWPDDAAYAAWQAAPMRAEFSQGIADAAGDNVGATSEMFQVAFGG